MKKTLIALIVCACAIFMLTACDSNKKDYEDAVELYNNHDFNTAAEKLEALGDYEDSKIYLEKIQIYKALPQKVLDANENLQFIKTYAGNKNGSGQMDIADSMLNDISGWCGDLNIDLIKEDDEKLAEIINTYQVEIDNTLNSLKKMGETDSYSDANSARTNASSALQAGEELLKYLSE